MLQAVIPKVSEAALEAARQRFDQNNKHLPLSFDQIMEMLTKRTSVTWMADQANISKQAMSLKIERYFSPLIGKTCAELQEELFELRKKRDWENRQRRRLFHSVVLGPVANAAKQQSLSVTPFSPKEKRERRFSNLLKINEVSCVVYRGMKTVVTKPRGTSQQRYIHLCFCRDALERVKVCAILLTTPELSGLYFAPAAKIRRAFFKNEVGNSRSLFVPVLETGTELHFDIRPYKDNWEVFM